MTITHARVVLWDVTKFMDAANPWLSNWAREWKGNSRVTRGVQQKLRVFSVIFILRNIRTGLSFSADCDLLWNTKTWTGQEHTGNPIFFYTLIWVPLQYLLMYVLTQTLYTHTTLTPCVHKQPYNYTQITSRLSWDHRSIHGSIDKGHVILHLWLHVWEKLNLLDKPGERRELRFAGIELALAARSPSGPAIRAPLGSRNPTFSYQRFASHCPTGLRILLLAVVCREQACSTI
jgi:hypothetical protein